MPMSSTKGSSVTLSSSGIPRAVRVLSSTKSKLPSCGMTSLLTKNLRMTPAAINARETSCGTEEESCRYFFIFLIFYIYIYFIIRSEKFGSLN